MVSADEIENVGQRSRNIYNDYVDESLKGTRPDNSRLDVETLVLVEGVETDAVDDR